MKIVRRLVAGKHVRTLRRSDVSEKELEEAQAHLIGGGVAMLPELLELAREEGIRPRVMPVLLQIAATDGLGPLVDTLLSEDVVLARVATDVLSEAEDYDVMPLLDALPGAGAARGRIEAILRARADSLPLRKLLPTLEDETNDARDLIFRLLEAHGDTSMVPHVCRMLDHESIWVRRHSIKLLAKYPTENGLAAIRGALRDQDASVRLESVRTLARLECTEALEDLAEALRDGDLKVHAAAIEALTAIGDVRAVPHLVEVLKDESEYARRGAVEVLNEVATTDAIKDLVIALRDADWWVRVRAADALGSLGGERVVEALLELLDNEDDFIRRYAVEILITVHDARAVEPLIRRLRDTDWWVRERAIDALAKIGDSRAVEPLIEIMAVDPDASPLCARALGQLADERAVDPLCDLAASGSSEQSQEAIASLQNLARAEISTEKRKRIRETLGLMGVSPGDSHMVPMPIRPREIPPPASGLGSSAGDVAPPLARADNTQAVGGDNPTPGTPRRMRPPDSPGSRPAPQSEPSPAATGASNDAAFPSPEIPRPETPIDVKALAEGQLLRGRYEIIRKIGAGGFGSVFLVLDRTIGDEMILKILSPHISQDETIIKRFVHELKYTRRITHRNVIRLFDFLDFDGVHAISMEYFPGEDLSKILRKEGRLEPRRVLTIAGQICEGLAAAHEEGIIHRDIKPPNILVDRDETVKIVDFGLASMAQQNGSQLTRSGIIIGTPQYMAPEQITGDASDERTDLYALGVVMFEMLTGSQPYKGENAVNILFQHVEGKPPSIRELAPEVPEEIEALVYRAISKEKDDRPQSAVAFHDMIHALTPQATGE